MFPFRRFILLLVPAVALAALMSGCRGRMPETPLKEAAKRSEVGDEPQLMGESGPIEFRPSPAPPAGRKIAKTATPPASAAGRPVVTPDPGPGGREPTPTAIAAKAAPTPKARPRPRHGQKLLPGVMLTSIRPMGPQRSWAPPPAIASAAAGASETGSSRASPKLKPAPAPTGPAEARPAPAPKAAPAKPAAAAPPPPPLGPEAPAHTASPAGPAGPAIAAAPAAKRVPPAPAAKPEPTTQHSPSMKSAKASLATQPFDPAGWQRNRPGAPAPAQAAPSRQIGEHLVAGDEALARDDYKAAVKSFYRAFAIDPERVDTLQGLAIALAAADRPGEAVSVYEMLLGLNPHDRVTRYNLAIALSRVHRLDEAETQYRRLLATDDTDVRVWYNLATLCQAQGKLAAAREAWGEVIRRAEKLESARTMLGQVLMDLGKPKQAMQSYAAAAQLHPEAVSTWHNLAISSRAAGSYGRALGALKQAIRRAPQDAALWALQGQFLLELHRATDKKTFLTEAVTSWQKSLELDPEQAKLKELMETYAPLVAGQAGRPG